MRTELLFPLLQYRRLGKQDLRTRIFLGPCYSWCSALRMSRRYITPRTRSEALSLKSMEELHAGIFRSPKVLVSCRISSEPQLMRGIILVPKYFHWVPSISFGTFPIMKSFDLAILTIMLGTLYPNTTPTPCVDPIGTNCISLVIFL